MSKKEVHEIVPFYNEKDIVLKIQSFAEFAMDMVPVVFALGRTLKKIENFIDRDKD